MDALSDVLRAIRLTGAIFFDVHASEPWVAETPPGPSIVGRIFPGAEHLVSYHVVTRGAFWGGLVDGEPRRLAAGDVLVFPHGDGHVLSSVRGMRETPDLGRYRRPPDGRLPFTLSMGTPQSDPARFVCGFLGCDARPFNPLLTALPRVIHLSERAGGATGALVAFALAESKQPRMGSGCVLGHLSELMFVDAVRRYVETLPAERTNWLAGLRDPHVGRALAAMHAAPSRTWTLEALGREAGLSRSAMAERFTLLVGYPPMQYLANWRMQLAANDLRGGTDSVAAIAARVGYDSEAAFSRAFKRLVGAPPSEWRKTRGGARRENTPDI